MKIFSLESGLMNNIISCHVLIVLRTLPGAGRGGPGVGVVRWEVGNLENNRFAICGRLLTFLCFTHRRNDNPNDRMNHNPSDKTCQKRFPGFPVCGW